MDNSMNDLLTLALQECQKLYKEDFPDNENERRIRQYGCFPKTAIVKYCSKISNGDVSGVTIKAWKMGMDSIEELHDLNLNSDTNHISGMYYSEGVFFFAISKDLQHIVINMILGPRYGVGLSYDIKHGDSGCFLINKTGLWVS